MRSVRRSLAVFSTIFIAAISVAVVPKAAQAATGYNALSGARLYDSRSFTPFANGETRTLVIAGSGGVPVNATAVVLNVTAVAPTASGFFTVWPAGQTRPGTSNVNFKPGDTVPNAVIVQLGSGGAVNLYNLGGSAHMLVDVAGYFEGGFIGVTPTRLLDTRSSLPTANDHVVLVAGQAGIPSDVAGVVLNVTAVLPASPGYATVHPDGSPQPNASNLNFVGNEVVANAVAVGLGSNGSVRISHESPGVSHYLVDVFGYFPSGSYVAVSPTRVFDSRKGAGGRGLIRDGETFVMGVAGVAGIPASGVGAVLANITVTSPTRGGFVTVWPNGIAKPNTSVLNFSAGQTKPNLAVITLGNAGAINVYVSSGSAHVLIDVLGYFPGTTSAAAASAPPAPIAPTITNSGVSEWNAFRASGRSCAAGFYGVAQPVKPDDTLQAIAQAHSNNMAAAQSGISIADATITGSEYRGLLPPDFDWVILSGDASSTVTAALQFLSTVTSFDYCSIVYSVTSDAAVATSVSANGRKFFTFVLNTPSFPSMFTSTGSPGLIRPNREPRALVEMP